MADFERSLTVGVTADAAFEYLADPANVAEYVGPISLLESIAIEGDPSEIANMALVEALFLQRYAEAVDS